MLCVCSEWRQVVAEAKKSRPEWRSTLLGPSANGSDSLELLRTNHLKWADTRFAPDLVLLSAASKDSSPWHSGGYWEEAIAAIEEAKLLPPRCKIVGVFTMNAVLGLEEGEEEVEEDTNDSAVTMSISVAHLPETTLEMVEFDRKDLRRYHHGGVELENPFTSLGEQDTPSFLMFGVNDQSARHLVPAIEEWYPVVWSKHGKTESHGRAEAQNS
ncbi:Avr1b-1 avirulence protein [Phytophthora cinnamomi]|uniref:Avr1b-1 avirulence protein n=1 Tax=Phytophthora cinnamomi TaxID=4785 RepID=UPI003559C030|nr:Avr1b-1 avirulence protein [Phytophthora cinnamomi]